MLLECVPFDEQTKKKTRLMGEEYQPDQRPLQDTLDSNEYRRWISNGSSSNAYRLVSIQDQQVETIKLNLRVIDISVGSRADVVTQILYCPGILLGKSRRSQAFADDLSEEC